MVVSDFGRDQSGRRFADLAIDEITTAGGRAVANYDSVITMAGGAAIVDAAVKAFGRVDVLVLPAGNYKERFLVDMTEEDWNLQINVNLNGHFTCIRAALPQLIKPRYGRIITVASRAAFGRPRGGMAYSAAKSAVMGRHCADVARAQAVRQGITVNCLLPSAKTTLFPKTEQRAGSPLLESGSLDPAWIAPTVGYLCSDAARGITGQFIYSSGTDVMVHHYPLSMQTILHKDGKWTVDELAEAVPHLLSFRG